MARDGDPQPAFLHGISILLAFLWTELRNYLLSKHGKETPTEPQGFQEHSGFANCQVETAPSRRGCCRSQPISQASQRKVTVSQALATCMRILSPGSRGRSRDGCLTRARSSLRSSWSVFVSAWAAAQHGCCCSRHLQCGLLTTNFTGDAFCFSEWRNAMNSKKDPALQYPQKLHRGLVTPSSKDFSPPYPCLYPRIMDGQRRKGTPLHHSGKTRESPAAAGPCMDPQSNECQEGELGPMLAAAYKASSGKGKHLIKRTNSRFKWKTKTSSFFSCNR